MLANTGSRAGEPDTLVAHPRSDLQAVYNLEGQTQNQRETRHRNQAAQDRNWASQSRKENANQIESLEARQSALQNDGTGIRHQEETNFKIAKIAAVGSATVGLIWLLVTKKRSAFRDIKQTLTTAKKHTADLEALERELTTQSLSNDAPIVTLFKQCNIKRLTRELETAVTLVNTRVKQEWTTLRKAHEKFLDAWNSIRTILDSANQDALNGSLIKARNTLNKMHAHLKAIDTACVAS